MRKIIFIFVLFYLSPNMVAQFSINGKFSANGEYVEEKAASGLGLENIYIFKTLSGASIAYETAKTNSMRIYSYQNSLSDKVDVLSENISITTLGDKSTYTVSNLQDSRGLVMEDNGQFRSVWVVDYSLHKPILNSITPSEEKDRCKMLKLVVDKSDALEYKGTNGQTREVVRKYDISYDILDWDDNNKSFSETIYKIEGVDIGTEFTIDRELDKFPNKDTQFTLRGDHFGKKFTEQFEVVSDLYEAVSVKGYIDAVQEERDVSNEIKEDGELGGSAPVDIKFFGYANDKEPATNFYTWFIYEKKDKNNPVARYTDKDFEYTFEQYGDYQVMLEVADATSTCVDTTSVQFSISESFLDIPNFFSPGSSPGSNDEFRVAYKSLVKFKCVIFNRWGNKVYEFNDPSHGWNGRYKGKLVNPGVYYYSIEATGSDGKKYKKGGDINILN